MDTRLFKLGALALVSSPLLSACAPSIASMTCDRMAEEARNTSQAQQYKISEIRNTRETQRTETEARCEGEATWNDNSTSPVYLRAYKEGDNTMVAYQNQPFN